MPKNYYLAWLYYFKAKVFKKLNYVILLIGARVFFNMDSVNIILLNEQIRTFLLGVNNR